MGNQIPMSFQMKLIEEFPKNPTQKRISSTKYYWVGTRTFLSVCSPLSISFFSYSGSHSYHFIPMSCLRLFLCQFSWYCFFISSISHNHSSIRYSLFWRPFISSSLYLLCLPQIFVFVSSIPAFAFILTDPYLQEEEDKKDEGITQEERFQGFEAHELGFRRRIRSQGHDISVRVSPM